MDNDAIRQNLEAMQAEYGNHDFWTTELNYGYKWSAEDKIKGLIEFFSSYHALPTPRILEIAVGYGRVSKELVKRCDEFYGIDLNECCVDFCRKTIPAGTFMVTDGVSIPYDAAVKFDLIVSHASMVHFDKDIIAAYVRDAADRLASGGTIIFHHAANGVNKRYGNRSNMTAEMMSEFCDRVGLQLVKQVFWYPLEDGRFNDCVSILKA